MIASISDKKLTNKIEEQRRGPASTVVEHLTSVQM
jgi:hypothetical protein